MFGEECQGSNNTRRKCTTQKHHVKVKEINNRQMEEQEHNRKVKLVWHGKQSGKSGQMHQYTEYILGS